MRRDNESVSVLLLEPRLFLRERLAAALARQPEVWCVVQLAHPGDLIRGVLEQRPDLVLASLGVLRQPGSLNAIRRHAPRSDVVGLVDAIEAPYVEVARDLGLDGLLERARVGEGLLANVQLANRDPESSREPRT